MATASAARRRTPEAANSASETRVGISADSLCEIAATQRETANVIREMQFCKMRRLMSSLLMSGKPANRLKNYTAQPDLQCWRRLGVVGPGKRLWRRLPYREEQRLPGRYSATPNVGR